MFAKTLLPAMRGTMMYRALASKGNLIIFIAVIKVTVLAESITEGEVKSLKSMIRVSENSCR